MTQKVHLSKASALEAVNRNGLFLQHASDDLRADREVVLAAVRNRGDALLFANAELQADKELVLEAVRQHGEALPYASKDLRGDRDIVSEAMRTFGQALSYASDELRSVGQGAVLEAVQLCGLTLQFALAPARDDPQVVLEAVRSNGLALQHASERLQGDKDLVLQAVQQCGDALQFASPDMRADKEVVLEAVIQQGAALNYASLGLRADDEVVLQAMKQNVHSLLYASHKLRASKDLVLLAVRTDPKSVNLPGLEAICKDGQFLAVLNSAIAVKGEAAPILSIRLARDLTDPNILTCEASLMSGASFVCRMEQTYSFLDRWVLKRRPGPTVNHLAAKLVDQMPIKTEVKNAERIFINFAVGPDGEAVAISPWDGDRPLTNFL
eukprot:CAMPEP_0206625960 /NCGR_PEP_ID=MMETSP0325_2-20121206/65034_1 /ASSEMBLY_ACC=CAM_ASM_000347 /TAXON_ID=2866 /ORGANISM="Crypthecodinium cohnii, Strain Seligo" /LENGTH=382 /DNA_ID=CAMNT_0054150219 /DNA_START=77 /DNA_END=1226 /DNA_ORIENTATION=-